jgi:Tfp pilus assembly protein PilF
MKAFSPENLALCLHDRKNNYSIYLFIAFLCFVIYFKCLFFGITNSDEEVMITGNLPFLHHLGNALKVFTTDAFYLQKEIDLYRPLQSLTYILDAQWGGDTVFFSHLTNLLLHILCCFTVFHLLKRLEFREPLAFLGALIYAVHYLFMTGVAWIPARGDLLLALFTFLSLLALIHSMDQPTWHSISIHLICFTLALFSKESGVVLPLLFAIYCWTYGKRERLCRRHLLLPAYYLVATAGYWFLKSISVADSGDERGAVQFVRNLHQLPEMVAKFYLPVNMSTLPAFSLSSTLCGILIAVLLLAIHVINKKLHQRRALFPPAWFLLFILPGMTYYPNFYFFSNEHVDHRSYLICFGLLMLNLNLVQQLDLERHRFFPVAALALLCYLALFNLSLIGSYRNPETFALKAITMGSNSALAYSNYGAEKFLQGDELEALRNLNQALRISRKFMPALHYRARIFAKRGMNREALADLDAIFSVDPKYDATDYGLRGTIKAKLQDNAGAEEDFSTALRLAPELVEARLALGSLLYSEGRGKEACDVWGPAAAKGNSSAAGLIAEYCKK